MYFIIIIPCNIHFNIHLSFSILYSFRFRDLRIGLAYLFQCTVVDTAENNPPIPPMSEEPPMFPWVISSFYCLGQTLRGQMTSACAMVVRIAS